MLVAKYRLTPSIRRRLKKPLGQLLVSPQLRSRSHLSELKEAAFVITVGDRVTETVHRLGRTPDVQVVDLRERREERKAPNVPFTKLIRVKNPAGTITDEAVSAISSAMGEEGPVRVLVDGEEDLLSIPAVAEAPRGAFLYYGQPKKGVVLIRVDEKARALATETLRRMRRERASERELT